MLGKFSEKDLDRLREHFDRLDALFQSEEATHLRGFLGKPTEFYFEELSRRPNRRACRRGLAL